MVERPDQIERHIASTRSELGGHLQELEEKVKQAADWKTYFARRPMTIMGLAFGGGVLLASMMGPRRERVPERAEVPMMRPERGDSSAGIPRRQMGDTWDTLKSALIGFTALKVRNALDEVLPGFGDQFERAERENSAYRMSHPLNHEHEFGSAHKM